MIPLAFALCMLTAANGETEHWPTWRGRDGAGAAPSATPPLVWSEDRNVRFKVAIPGRGHATPVVWGDTLFLLTAVDTGQLPEGAAPETPAAEQGGGQGGGRGGRGRPSRPLTVQRFTVLALDRLSGETRWETCVREAAPHEGTHNDGTFASASAVVDGEHVYANFGSRGLYCLDHAGEIVWEKDLGDMTVRGTFGEGASPALTATTLVVPWDHEGESFVVALDKGTGDEKWRTSRAERTNWATPLVVEVEGRSQVILNAPTARAYDLETGEEVWHLSGMTDNVIPGPIHHDGMVFLGSGFRGAALKAVDLAGAEGDLSTKPALLWSYDKDMPYVPSLALCDRYLYALKGNNGILTVVDIEKGEVVHGPARLEGAQNVYASPLCAGGRLYVVSRDGATVVLEHGGGFEVLATNTLDEGCDASPVAIGDWLYLRTRTHLYGLGEKAE